MIIFGDKTLALFDLWSLEHFFTGCNTAVALAFFSKKFLSKYDQKSQETMQVMMMLLLELLWEVIEHYLEAGISHEAITNWFQGVEYFWNRAFFDPIVTVLGLFFIRRFPRMKIFAAVFSIVWLYVNIFIYSDCMGLNRDLINLISKI